LIELGLRQPPATRTRQSEDRFGGLDIILTYKISIKNIMAEFREIILMNYKV